MWVKVDDRFPNHHKVFSAGAHLSGCGSGRVIAIWVEGMTWTNSPENSTRGYLPDSVVRSFRHDRTPLQVADAMAKPCRRTDGTMGPGLLIRVEGGYQVHDYDDHNPSVEEQAALSAKRSASGRLGGLKSGEARRRAKLKQVLQQNGSNCASNGHAKSNPVPDPVPEDQDQEEHRAEAARECACPVEKSEDRPRRLSKLERREIAKSTFAAMSPGKQHDLLVAMTSAEYEAGRIVGDTVEDMEHLKDVASRSKFSPINGTMLRKALDCVFAARGLKVGA